MRRLLLPLFWLIELPVVVLGALLLLSWLWSGSEESLDSALRQASRYLPPGHTLVAEDVRGSVRRGGHIGSLRWQSNGLSVQARGIELAWQPVDLLNLRLRLDTLHLAELRIDDQSPPSGPAPPDDLVLPFLVDLDFVIDRLVWAGPPALEATAVSGRYAFDLQRHLVTIDKAQVAAGSYQAKASLLARAPMTLDLQAQGKVLAPIGARSIRLDAAATLRGPLAGSNPLLELVARLQPDETIAGQATTHKMDATVSGQLSPWATQPIQHAQASFSQLNLAALWSNAPQTLLSGQARVQPRGHSWQAQFDLTNQLAGPWDTGRLPLDRATGQLEYAAGQWNILALDAASAGGHITAQGHLGDSATLRAASGWQGRLRLQGLDPALLHSQLAPARLDGELQARAEQDAILFEARLQPSGQQPAASALHRLRLQSASTSGRWAEGWLRLHKLQFQADEAQLQGQLDLQVATGTARGQLQLELPGAQASASAQLGALDGTGELSVQVSDAARAARWLARLPQAATLLARIDPHGPAQATLHWQGGWQALQTGRGVEPSFQMQLKLAQLELPRPGQAASQNLRLRDFQGELSGRLSALSFTGSGALHRGNQQLQMQLQAAGGRGANGDWQLEVRPQRLQLHDGVHPGPWSLILRQPLVLEWQATPSGGTLRAGAGEAQLSGPLPAVVTLTWQPARWSFGARSELASQGQLRGLPLAWLELFGDAQLANLGLSGDMLFDAEWDVVAADSLRLRAALVRRSGDIRVLADEPTNATTPGANASATIDAGVRDARITLDAQGDTLRAALRWDSERAGTAQVDFSTRLQDGANGWDWAADAPLSATVRARLPQVGVWSALAPPGWRMRGTLDADLALSGTRLAPHWTGTLQADGLALRSVVDGVEFGNGRLRASMSGQRLDINELSLQGAGGPSGGELSARGFAQWLAPAEAANPGLARLRIELDASARALRVSARADRRLVLSGTMQGRLGNGRLGIGGALTADQALFILPDESAPSLGDDVVLRPPLRARATGAATVPGNSGVAQRGATGTPVSTTLSVALDLGNDFQVRGRGINTRLAGTLQLASPALASEAPRLSGQVGTVRGSYRAYGQLLDIEQGVLRFTGAYDNPALDILAIRPNLAQRVGVQVSGTALVPRVRLFSEPELPQAEKLAWLVLGRSGANGGAEAAVLQQAAFALLGPNGQGLSGGLAGALGLDELSIAGTGGATSSGAGAATVTLGKRLSRDFYVAYERSLAGTLGTFSIFYELSRRFTLRARTGEQNTIDLIFTQSYD